MLPGVGRIGSHSPNKGVGAPPPGYAWLLYKDADGNYVPLLYKDAVGNYVRLAYKVA